MLAVVWNVCTPRPTLSWANAPACFDFDERKVVEGRTHAGASQLQKLRGRLVSVERGRVWKRGSRERAVGLVRGSGGTSLWRCWLLSCAQGGQTELLPVFLNEDMGDPRPARFVQGLARQVSMTDLNCARRCPAIRESAKTFSSSNLRVLVLRRSNGVEEKTGHLSTNKGGCASGVE